ncbi:hypothetical protein B0H12DRAFT_50239 [Mycena haematopus]|nr:hypothetical protein B0H12DRAFT_50239 [Mycena haematopus]
MSPAELELTATITYEGAKARIATAEEAVPILRLGNPLARATSNPLIHCADLTALGIPHPKKTNVSVVYPGVVRFFWIASPHSVIRYKLIDRIRPNYDLDAHRLLLNELSIRSMTLQESPAPLDTPQNTFGGPSSLIATSMAGRGQEWHQSRSANAPSGFDSSYGRSVGQPNSDSRYLERKTSADSPTKHQQFGQLQSPVKIKTEPVVDTIPPSRRPYYEEDRMQLDTPPRSSESKKPLNRNRYKSIPNFDHPPEVQALQRELRDIRRQLNADIVQERTIVENLRELGTEVDSDTSETDFVTKVRLELFEAELQEERARRRRLEEIIEDIRRERREPFVVPALLDAFIEISKLTNEALEEG